MNYIDIFNDKILVTISKKLNIEFNSINYNNIPSIYTHYIKLSTAFFSFSLILFTLLLIINIIVFSYFKRTSFLTKFFFYINILVSFVIEILLFIKIYLSFTIESILKGFMLQEKLRFYKNNKSVETLEHFIVFPSAFSDIIVLLSVIIGLFCLDILGSKNYFKNINNNSIFYLFNIFVLIMASTNNLLVMFICFEFIFLPTVFFAYKLGYSKKIDQATITLFLWTLMGSFLVLCGLLYIYYQYSTLNYLSLLEKKFSSIEKKVLFFTFLFGFSVKIPLAPLHHWLLKVHVESPTAYSIFLSGFLVKSSLYCLSMVLQYFYSHGVSAIALTWFLYSMLAGTLGMGRQSDLKRLIAWCTVQEMSFIIMLWGMKHTYVDKSYLVFIVIHGLLSAYMFFLVDIIQRRYRTRNILAITGMNFTSPQLTKYVWFLVLLFSGLPLTAKFAMEWSFFSLMYHSGFVLFVVVTVIVNVLGILFFSKIFFTILYGAPQKIIEPMTIDIQKKELNVLNSLGQSILILSFIVYII